jgi:hypothetical protein
MRSMRIAASIVLVAVLVVYSCTMVPLTGRKQLSLVSDSEMLSISFGSARTHRR